MWYLNFWQTYSLINGFVSFLLHFKRASYYSYSYVNPFWLEVLPGICILSVFFIIIAISFTISPNILKGFLFCILFGATHRNFILPSQYLFVQNQQYKHQNNVWKNPFDLLMKMPEQRYWRQSGVFIVNFKQISNIFLMFLLLTLNSQNSGLVFINSQSL